MMAADEVQFTAQVVVILLSMRLWQDKSGLGSGGKLCYTRVGSGTVGLVKGALKRAL